MSDPTAPRPVPDLHALLPAVHRTEDLRQGGPLQALLDVLSAQADLVRRDIDGLWDDLFIATCADWVVPYLGDLVGARPLHDVDQALRRDVARTIERRSRKGVLPMLEELAHDATGWGIHAVAERERLAWSQHLAHVRSHGPPLRASARLDPAVSLVGPIEVRDADRMDRVGGAFDEAARTVDVRHHRRDRARPHVRNVTFHAAPHKVLPVEHVVLQRVDLPAGHPHAGRAFRIGHLQADIPLFAQARLPPGSATDPALPPFEAARPIRPLALHLDLEQARRRRLAREPGEAAYVGPDRSLVFWDGRTPVPARRIHAMDLSEWGAVPSPADPAHLVSAIPDRLRYVDHMGVGIKDATGAVRPLTVSAAVDPRTGRVVLAGKGERRLRVTYHRGVPAHLGGGSYWRPRPEPTAPPQDRWRAVVPGDYPGIGEALNAWEASGVRSGLLEVASNGVREAVASIRLPPNGELVVRSKDRFWPHLRADLRRAKDLASPHLRISIEAYGAKDARLVLDGFCVQGQVRVHGELELHVQHCTLVPGLQLTPECLPAEPQEPSLVAGAHMDLDLHLDHAITGPLRLPPESARITARDSILQAPGGELAVAGPDLELERCTVFGRVAARTLHASETLFVEPVTVERRQAGCVRYSHVPHGSATPRRFQCQPDLAVAALGKDATPEERDLARARVAPIFLSRRYGHPDHARLRPDTDEAVREGAEGGAEMGAHHLLRDPHREQNLDARMAESLPPGRRPTLDIQEDRP